MLVYDGPTDAMARDCGKGPLEGDLCDVVMTGLICPGSLTVWCSSEVLGGVSPTVEELLGGVWAISCSGFFGSRDMLCC